MRRLFTMDAIPVVCAALLEYANFGQLYRMWTERTAAGQSLQAWLTVCVALILFTIYYHKKGLRVPFWTTLSSVGFNCAVWMTVIYFRYFVQ